MAEVQGETNFFGVGGFDMALLVRINSIFVTIDIPLHSLQYFKEGTLRTEPPKVAELL